MCVEGFKVGGVVSSQGEGVLSCQGAVASCLEEAFPSGLLGQGAYPLAAPLEDAFQGAGPSCQGVGLHGP